MSDEVTPATSQRVCSHMNLDHAPTVHAFCISTLSGRDARLKVTNAKMESVSLEEYTLSFVLCDGDSCMMKTASVPFVPKLTSSKELRPRLIQDHHRALNPKFSWLVTDPRIRTSFPVIVLLGVGTHVYGEEGLSTLMEGMPWASASVSATFPWIVVWAWYVTVLAHILEASYAAYECKRRLQMTAATTLKWFVLVLATGYPVTRKVMELAEVDKAARSTKKK